MNRIVVNNIPDTLSVSSYELVLTPTKAIARSIKTFHRTLESVAETIVKKKGLRIASVLLARRTLQNAIAEILKVKDILGVTALWTPIIQELLSSGIDLLALQEHSITRVSILARVTICYQEQLKKINCIDRSELFWQATKHCQDKKSYLFYGYFAPNLDRLAFINTLSGNNSLLVLPCEEDKIFSNNQNSIDWLKTQGWQFIQKSRDKTLGEELQQYYLNQQNKLSSTTNLSLSSSEVLLNHYPNLEAEVRGVLTQVKLLLDRGISPHNIVLVTKDEQLYGDTLLDIAWEYDVPLRAFYDVSLLTTRIGAWLQILLEIIITINSSDKLSFEAVIKLLFHPLVKQLNSETWAKARIAHPQTIKDWQTIGIDLSLLQLPIKAKSDRWLQIWQHIMETFNIPQKVKPWAKEIVAYYKFQEALQELLLTTNKVITRETIITEIQELLTSLTIPIQPGRGGVELHSPLSLFGSKYQYVFVLGMAENIFPTAISDDLVLGYCDRKQLSQENININTIVKIMQKEALAFYFLLQIPTKQISFSSPQVIDRQPTYPSPYLADLNLLPVPVEKKYITSIEEARTIYLRQGNIPDNLLTLIRQKWQIEQNREDKITNEYNGLVGITLDPQKFTFSASQLTQIGQCPFKWFASKLLKLQEIAETKLILENNTRGSLYHQCLELCLSKINTAADLEKFNWQQLQQAFQEAETNLHIPDIPSWMTQKQEVLNLLSINLNTPNFLPIDSEIIAREKEFATQWHGLNIKGTIDRLDRTSTGIKVIDYKSSSSPPVGIKDRSGKATIDIQIPLYIDAMAQEYPQENIDAVYYSLSKCKPIRRNKTNPEDLEQFAEKVKQHLTEGNYPVEPDIQFKACNYCQFDLVCRKNKG
ncbi:conserved hypothetical protein [Hyella patelloides LEGE 07179]|uniref:PD-(D/E)XK endonuclease-like domain-containing protein n=1 Tax=Hyella patelloides LEGE 07179 TaxID=945734 RepID=A0A563W4L9_9CYAN|nr:PD-(D/E)XK nuclease family protein [Hyella patelloides]VEP18606.1 conserved hypothetical protein [Hyella patelloides LEGE 07179]